MEATLHAVSVVSVKGLTSRDQCRKVDYGTLLLRRASVMPSVCLSVCLSAGSSLTAGWYSCSRVSYVCSPHRLIIFTYSEGLCVATAVNAVVMSELKIESIGFDSVVESIGKYSLKIAQVRLPQGFMTQVCKTSYKLRHYPTSPAAR